MKNNCAVFFCIFFTAAFCNAQNFKISKTIADKTTKKGLENVSIYNDKDYSTTNEDGVFVFISSKNEVNFNLLGYNSIQTTFEALQKQDTLFMEFKAFQLKEIVVSNLEPFIKKVYAKMEENYVSKYTSNFFLRNVLKKDDKIKVLQDIHGKRGKNSNLKNPNEIQVLNMRKTSFFEKNNQIDFKFPNFTEFFKNHFPALDKNTFTEENYNDPSFRKILFELKEKNVEGQICKGYFLINRDDYAIVEFFIALRDNPDVIPFKKITSADVQYRTVYYDKLNKFSKNSILNKYYLQLSQLAASVEVIPGATGESKFYFNLNMDYFTTNACTAEKVTPNFANDKDVFKAKFSYSAEFWNKQNQLPLTKELQDFLHQVSENKDKKKEFEIIGNF